MGREISALFYLTSTTMKAFIVLSLAATALAVPGRGGRRQGGNKGAQKKDKMDPGIILRCRRELWQQPDDQGVPRVFLSGDGLQQPRWLGRGQGLCIPVLAEGSCCLWNRDLRDGSRKHGSPGDCGRVLRRQAGEGERGEVLGGGDFNRAAGSDDRGHHVHP